MPVSGAISNNLVIQVIPHYINGGPTDTVHYDSTSSPSRFTLPWGPSPQSTLPEVPVAAGLPIMGSAVALVAVAAMRRRRRKGESAIVV